MKTLHAALLALALAPAAALAQQPAATPPTQPLPRLPADSVARAERFVRWFLEGRADSMYGALDSAGRLQMGSAEQMQRQLDQILSQVGAPERTVEERWVRRNGRRQYWRFVQFTDFQQEPIVLRVVIMPDGTLGGFGINPGSQAPPVDPEHTP